MIQEIEPRFKESKLIVCNKRNCNIWVESTPRYYMEHIHQEITHKGLLRAIINHNNSK